MKKKKEMGSIRYMKCMTTTNQHAIRCYDELDTKWGCRRYQFSHHIVANIPRNRCATWVRATHVMVCCLCVAHRNTSTHMLRETTSTLCRIGCTLTQLDFKTFTWMFCGNKITIIPGQSVMLYKQDCTDILMVCAYFVFNVLFCFIAFSSGHTNSFKAKNAFRELIAIH